MCKEHIIFGSWNSVIAILILIVVSEKNEYRIIYFKNIIWEFFYYTNIK